MKKVTKYTVLSLFIVLSACVKIELEDMPDPPVDTKGNIRLSLDWSKRTQGIDIPASYTVNINNRSLNFENAVNPLPEMEAGRYPVIIYNTADNISLNGTVASIKTENETVDPLPGWLFTATEEIIYEAGRDKTVTVEMTQQIRQLVFDFTITGGNLDNIQSISVSLSGIASGMDFKENTYIGTGLQVIPALNKDDRKLSGSIRLIGISGETQEITMDISYITGHTQQLISDISSELTNFNQNKHIALTLSATIEISDSNEAGFEAVINGWEAKEGNNGIAW